MRDTCQPRANPRAGDASETTSERGRGSWAKWPRDRDIVAAAFPRWTYRDRAAHRKLADIRARMARRILLITRDTQAHKLRAPTPERLETADLSKRDAKSSGS